MMVGSMADMGKDIRWCIKWYTTSIGSGKSHIWSLSRCFVQLLGILLGLGLCSHIRLRQGHHHLLKLQLLVQVPVVADKLAVAGILAAEQWLLLSYFLNYFIYIANLYLNQNDWGFGVLGFWGLCRAFKSLFSRNSLLLDFVWWITLYMDKI